MDPCNAGTIPAGKPLPSWILPPLQPFGSPELLPGPLQMNCYYGGKGWMKDPTMGMCGYNITLRNSMGDYCTSVSEPNCGLVIDPRRVPCCGGTPQCEGDDNAGGNIKGALTVFRRQKGWVSRARMDGSRHSDYLWSGVVLPEPVLVKTLNPLGGLRRPDSPPPKKPNIQYFRNIFEKTSTNPFSLKKLTF